VPVKTFVSFGVLLLQLMDLLIERPGICQPVFFYQISCIALRFFMRSVSLYEKSRSRSTSVTSCCRWYATLLSRSNGVRSDPGAPDVAAMISAAGPAAVHRIGVAVHIESLPKLTPRPYQYDPAIARAFWARMAARSRSLSASPDTFRNTDGHVEPGIIGYRYTALGHLILQ